MTVMQLAELETTNARISIVVPIRITLLLYLSRRPSRELVSPVRRSRQAFRSTILRC
nr:MAG TPA: hypothetical protein [Caudoviricetes sp.]